MINHNPTFQNPMMYNPQPMAYQPPTQYPRTTGNKIWVQGEAGAKSYLVAPNSSVDLWDSESHTIYIKSADPSGLPTMQILDYTIRGAEQEQKSESISYLVADDLNPILNDLDSVKQKFKMFDEQLKNLNKQIKILDKSSCKQVYSRGHKEEK